METMSLKALANKVLQRNPQGNLMETDTKIKGNFEEIFSSLDEKLRTYQLTADEIKALRPELYKQIQEAISAMDSAWLKEDLPEFSSAIKTIEELYCRALQEIPESVIDVIDEAAGGVDEGQADAI